MRVNHQLVVTAMIREMMRKLWEALRSKYRSMTNRDDEEGLGGFTVEELRLIGWAYEKGLDSVIFPDGREVLLRDLEEGKTGGRIRKGRAGG